MRERQTDRHTDAGRVSKRGSESLRQSDREKAREIETNRDRGRKR